MSRLVFFARRIIRGRPRCLVLLKRCGNMRLVIHRSHDFLMRFFSLNRMYMSK